jgi:hypothetical protein
MAALTHNTELFFLTVRLVTLALVCWDLWDAVHDLRGWWGRRSPELMLAKWRVAHDAYMLLLILTWVASMMWVLRSPLHGETTHVLLAFQNFVVVFLLVKTFYMRVIRIRIAEGWGE